VIAKILSALVFASLLVWFLRSKDRVAWLRYLYFLRFSLLIWWLPAILVGLKFLAYALASGLLVPEFLPGYLCVAFFASSTGYAALVMGRIVVINGEERLEEVPPGALTTLLAGRPGQERWQWIAPIVSQVFAVALFIYSLFAARRPYRLCARLHLLVCHQRLVLPGLPAAPYRRRAPPRQNTVVSAPSLRAHFKRRRSRQ